MFFIRNMFSYLVPVFVVKYSLFEDLCWATEEPCSQFGGCQDSQVLLLLMLSNWGFGQRESSSLRLWRALWRERDSFIPPGRNVIISITDETLPQEAFYAFVFPFILWPGGSTAPYSLYFFLFILLILPLLQDFDCCLRCCYIWNWLEGALSEFVTLFSDRSFSARARRLILN